MNAFIKYTLISILFVFTLLACKEEESEPLPQDNFTELVSAPVENLQYSIGIFSETAPEVGHFPFYIKVTDTATGQSVTDCSLTVTPMMHMMEMSHSSYINQLESTDYTDGAYPFEVVFVMPSGDMGYWEINVVLTDPDGNEHQSVALPVTVNEPASPVLKSFISTTDGAKVFVALVQPSTPEIGINNLEVIVFEKQSMMNFSGADQYAIIIEPEMPTMEHGSPNNKNPTHTANGHYIGKVNFTMSGLWRLHLSLDDAIGNAGDTSFDIEF